MKNFKLIFCLLCLFLISKISFSQATLNELDLSIFGIEPSLFEMSESQFINMNKEKKFEVKKAGSYTTWVYTEEREIMNLNKIIKMEYIFQDNYFSGLTYRFPIELDSYKELISVLKKNYNFTFIDDLNAYNFRLKTSEHYISVGVNSLPTEIKFELRIYRTEN